MPFFRKTVNILGRSLSNYVSQEVSSSKPYSFQAIRCMSCSKLFVGGISYSTNDMSLKEIFSKYGTVVEARVIVNRDSGRSRGFGFITFSSIDEASAAMHALDEEELHGRRIRVSYANDGARGYVTGGLRGSGHGGKFGSVGEDDFLGDKIHDRRR